MNNTEDLAAKYMKVSVAARELRRDTSWVYRAIARGELESLELGEIVVARDSVERLKARLAPWSDK